MQITIPVLIISSIDIIMILAMQIAIPVLII